MVKSLRIKDRETFVLECVTLYNKNIPFHARLNRQGEMLIQQAEPGLHVVYGDGSVGVATALLGKDVSYRYISPSSQIGASSSSERVNAAAADMSRWRDSDKDFLNYADLQGLAIVGRNWCKHTKRAVERSIAKGFDFQYFDLKTYRAGMYTEGMNILTSPVVILHGTVIGGCDDFFAKLQRASEAEKIAHSLKETSKNCTYLPLKEEGIEIEDLFKREYDLILNGKKKLIRVCFVDRLFS